MAASIVTTLAQKTKTGSAFLFKSLQFAVTPTALNDLSHMTSQLRSSVT